MSRYEQVAKNEYVLENFQEPVHIVASALLKDTVTLNYLAQIKLQNVSEFTIQKVSIVIVPYDAENNKVGSEITYIYDGLEISPDEEFGSNEAIPFIDIKSMSSFQATVKQVIFKEGLEWTIGQTIDDVKSEKNSTILSAIDSSIKREDFKKAIDAVDDVFDSNAKKEEIRNDIYRQCIEFAEKVVSSNGSVTRAKKVLEVVPDEYVGKKELQERIKGKKQKKRRIIAIVCASVVAVLLCALIGNSVHKYLMYKDAIKLGESGHYAEAIDKLTELDDYKDSHSYIEKYQTEIFEKEKEELTQSIRETYAKRNEYIADMDTVGLCQGIIRPDGDYYKWEEEKYEAETNLTADEISKLVKVHSICDDLSYMVLDIDKEWFIPFQFADLHYKTGANRAKDNYDFIPELKEADMPVATEIVKQFEKYKKDYVGKTYVFQATSGDGYGLDGDEKVLITTLAFQKKDKNKKLTADNLEPIVIVAVGEEGQNYMQGYGTIQDVKEGKKIYDGFSEYRYNEDTNESEADSHYEVQKDQYVVFSGDSAIWHYAGEDHLMKQKKWKYYGD